MPNPIDSLEKKLQQITQEGLAKNIIKSSANFKESLKRNTAGHITKTSGSEDSKLAKIDADLIQESV